MTLGLVAGSIFKPIAGVFGRAKEKRIRSTAMRFSPWSKMGVPEKEDKGNILTDIIGGAGAGAKGGQALGGLLGIGKAAAPAITTAAPAMTVTAPPVTSQQVAAFNPGLQAPMQQTNPWQKISLATNTAGPKYTLMG